MRTAKSPEIPGPRCDAGFSLLEVIICAGVLAIAVAGTAIAIMTACHLDNRTNYEALALAAAEDRLSQIRETPFDSIAATFSGQTFSVDNLPPPAAGQAHGEVIIINNEAPNEATFGRDLGVSGGGKGVDLDGNGLIDDDLVGGFGVDIDGDGIVPTAGAVASYSLIPVVVLIRWDSSEGIQRMQLVTTVANRHP